MFQLNTLLFLILEEIATLFLHDFSHGHQHRSGKADSPAHYCFIQMRIDESIEEVPGCKQVLHMSKALDFPGFLLACRMYM